MSAMSNESEVRQSFKLLLLASLLTLALWFVPFAGYLTFPIRLFVTFIHEAGHALAALVTLGSVKRVTLDWSGSGETITQGGFGLFISSAGYLATTIYGAALLLLLRRKRNVKVTAIATAVLLLFVTLLFGGNVLAWVTGLAFGAACIFLTYRAKPRLAHFFMSFLAVQCLLNAFYDLRTLLFLSAFDPNIQTDAQNMSEATGGFIPAILWSVGWAIISAAILVATLVVYYRSLRKREEIAAAPVPDLLPEYSAKAADRAL
jgi:Peptidase M50B-like